MGITDAVDMKSKRGCKFGIRISNFEKRKGGRGCERALGEGGPAPHKATQGFRGRWKAEVGSWKTEDGGRRTEGNGDGGFLRLQRMDG